MQEIFEELKKINKNIEYQTKLLEEIFNKKDEAQATRKTEMKKMVDMIARQFRAKGIDPSPLYKMVGIDKLFGENKK